jgi:hypothetical protein
MNLGTILNCEWKEVKEGAPVICSEISDNQENFKTQLLNNSFPFLRGPCGLLSS